MSEVPPIRSALAMAICAVMSQVHNVEKTGKNTFHNYKYASEADLLRALQPAMAAAGLALVPVGVARETSPAAKSAKGKEQWRTDVTVTYKLLHIDGETLEIQAVGSGCDPEDKGAYKAMTGALKYALRQLFLVPTGDDPDASEREDGRGDRGDRNGREEREPQRDRERDESPPSRAADPEPEAAPKDAPPGDAMKRTPRERFQGLWFATLADIGEKDLPRLDRRKVQKALFGHEHLADIPEDDLAELHGRLVKADAEKLLKAVQAAYLPF